MSDTDDPTPLAVLLTTMREKWAAGDRDGAAILARAAAPYLHPRLAAVTNTQLANLEPEKLTDAELAERLACVEARTRETEGDPDPS